MRWAGTPSRAAAVGALVALCLTGCGGERTAPQPPRLFGGAVRNIAWSPDGKRIAWGDVHRIWIAKRDGTAFHPVPARCGVSRLAWLSDGTFAYEALDETCGSWDIRHLTPGGGAPSIAAASGEGFAAGAAVLALDSPPCSWCSGPLPVVDVATGASRWINSSQKSLNYRPTVSPNGRWVAFERTWCDAGGHCGGPYAGIWVGSKRGGEAIQVSRSGTCPGVANDGRVAFFTPLWLNVARSAGDFEHAVPLRTWGEGTPCPRWSPDGDSIAYVDGDSPVGLFVADVRTHRTRRVTPQAVGDVMEFAWSPDSRSILVVSDACAQLWRVDLAPRAVVRISRC